MKIAHSLCLVLSGTILWSCSSKSDSSLSDLGDWSEETTVTKKVDNYSFTFPRSGYAFEHREEYVQECLNAFQSDAELIDVVDFTDSIHLRFVTSRGKMRELTDMAASGTANSWTRKIHFAVFDSTETKTDEVILNPPIKHEVMHMVSQRAWGYPGQDNAWINEGLATYAAGNCSGWTPQELYRFFMANDMLLPMDSIMTNFYAQDEMIGYHQSAVWVDYLISNYGIEKFKTLWRPEMSKSFEEIYGTSISEMEELIRHSLLMTVPEVPDIDWNVQKKGCYTRLDAE